MDDDSYDGRFLIFFLALAACSLLSVPTTWFVSNKKNVPDEKWYMMIIIFNQYFVIILIPHLSLELLLLLLSLVL